MQSLDWFMSDPQALEGYQWLANNTESDATVLAWWDYADGIEKIGHRGVVINEASRENQEYDCRLLDARKALEKIEYGSWYPYEDDEKVRDVANFFVLRTRQSQWISPENMVRGYALVMYPDDQGKYFAVITASGANLSDY